MSTGKKGSTGVKAKTMKPESAQEMRLRDLANARRMLAERLNHHEDFNTSGKHTDPRLKPQPKKKHPISQPFLRAARILKPE